MRPDYLLFGLLASLPVFAQDWGRYANGYVAPPSLVEIQVIRTPVLTYLPTYGSPKGGAHPNVHTTKDVRFTPPPGVGEQGRK